MSKNSGHAPSVRCGDILHAFPISFRLCAYSSFSSGLGMDNVPSIYRGEILQTKTHAVSINYARVRYTRREVNRQGRADKFMEDVPEETWAKFAHLFCLNCRSDYAILTVPF